VDLTLSKTINMFSKLSRFLFGNPDDIGLDNYLVLIFSIMCFVIGIVATVINIIIDIGLFTTISTAATASVFIVIYILSRKYNKYLLSKYSTIIIGIFILDVQWFSNYGSSGPILYLFIVIQSFIIVFLTKREKIYFTIFVFLDVTILFYIEYKYPELIGNYKSTSARLFDLYTGIIIYLVLSILLLNGALRFYIRQKEKAQLADKLKTSFLANMSHEIRTPMNGILGFAELLKEPNLTGQQQQEFIDIIEKSGNRMLSIINDIIDISKIESGLMKVDMREVNLNQVILELYTFFKPETDKKNIHLSILNSLPSDQSFIITDHEKLYAILVNLVKNAIKYTHKGSIEFGYLINEASLNKQLEFFIKDTGIGIPKERQQAIFERFVQADISDRWAYQGAGLGLSIAKAYVVMLGGTINVESETDQGTTFFFTVPYKPASGKKTTTEKVVDLQNRTGNLRILIVEDDEASEILLTTAVRSLSQEIINVKSGKEALDVCLTHKNIDLILLDIQIPDLNGLDVAREIRKFNKDVIIIAQTAFALSSDREKSIHAGCNDYITKPINRVALQILIKEYFPGTGSR
jgi:signal transduction histidine kinase